MKLAIKLKEMNGMFAKWVFYPTFPGKMDPYFLLFLFTKLQRIRMFFLSMIEQLYATFTANYTKFGTWKTEKNISYYCSERPQLHLVLYSLKILLHYFLF